MQAGDSLNFIEPFLGAERVDGASEEKISKEDLAILAQIKEQYIDRQQENVHSFEVFESYGFLTVFEASYRLDMPDGSYLHIVVFGSQVEDGVLDFGISLNEHLVDGVYNGGYVYMYDDEGFVRSTSRADEEPELDEDGEMSDDHRKLHFMVSDLYESRDALNELKFSDDPELREHAERAEERLAAELEFDEVMKASGFDSCPPPPGELAQVLTLIQDADPFPLHILK